MNRRKLSNIEHLADVNIACSLRLAGKLDLGKLQTALGYLQRRHPALRALIRPEHDLLYYEPNSAPEISFRVARSADDEIYRREWDLELSTGFHSELPQLRVVYFERECDCDLLFTTSHRICDGLSVFIIARDVLRFLAGHVEPNAHEEISTADLIGEYQPTRLWLTSTSVALVNTCLHLLPRSGPLPKRKESFAEWSVGHQASTALRQQCRAKGASMHAAFLVALDRALSLILGRRSPKFVTCPIDMRRGRFPALPEDMLFYGGGNFKVRTGRWIEGDFWDNARVLTAEIRADVEREVRELPGRLFLFDKLRPLGCGQVRFLNRVGETLRSKRRIAGIGLANLGIVKFSENDCPLPVRGIRFSARSLNFGVLGLIAYTVNDNMQFYCMYSENVLNESEMQALQQEFMGTLECQIERTCAKAVTA
ncbi:MAG TPA: hypothetical protein VHZ55_02740 [Bryobacteraceae bacterium]|jgi:hypothetical protein|nr:hypothetical protein [Bryobacteraceae bacterium]